MPDTCQTCGCKLGRTVKTPIDRSLGFTAMLELYPGFGQMPDTEGMGITTAFLEDWHKSGHTDMYAYAREWVADREIAEHTSPPEPGTAGHEPVVASEWKRTADGWFLPGHGADPGWALTDEAIAREGRERIEKMYSMGEGRGTPPLPEQAWQPAEPVYGPNADGNPYAQYTPEHRVWALAQVDGKAAAGWVFDGTTDQATYARYVKGIEDGDPEVMDSLREPSLSGEFSGEFTEDQLMAEAGWVPHDGTDMRDDLATQYNDEVSAAFWHEVERLARQHLSTAEGR